MRDNFSLPPDAGNQIVVYPDLAEAFLEIVHPGGPWHITAILHDKGSTITRTFAGPKRGEELAAFMQKWRTFNLYYSVARLRGPVSSKASKDDVAEVAWLHCDCDPRSGEPLDEERRRIRKLLAEDFRLKPTLTVDSGGGFNALWKLAEPLAVAGDPAKIEEAEARNRQLEVSLGGDHCHNVDRILRLPGSINWPNRKKRDRGRVAAPAELVAHHQDAVYPLSAFTAAPKIAATDATAAGPRRSRGSNVVRLQTIPSHVDLDALPIDDRCKVVIRYGYDPDDLAKYRKPGGTELDRSAAECFVIREMVRAGVPDAQIIGAMLEYPVGAKVREARNAQAEAARQIAKAREDVAAEQGGLRRIKIVSSELPRMLDEAEAAMLEQGLQVYQQLGRLVRPARLDRDEDEGGVSRPAGALVLQPLNKYWLREKLMTVARWLVWNAMAKALVPCAAPMEISSHYLARSGEWRLPVLLGIVEAPTMRADFSVLERPGYDDASRLIYDPGAAVFAPVPTAPSKAEAEAALAAIVDVIRCFPFRPEDAAEDWQPEPEEGKKPSASRSVMLSAILTGLVRHTMRAAPLHAFSATKAGTGKSLLARIVGIILTGRRAAALTQPRDEDEMRKRLLAVLAKGDPIVSIDNIERVLEGDSLCSVLTEDPWSERILGVSEMATVSTRRLFMASGNNIMFSGTMERRAVQAVLDARSEKPQEREFGFDAEMLAMDRRPQLVVAGLTILRAYVTAGRPLAGQVKPIGSFEDWTIIREALRWLDQPDPAETMASIIADDPESSQLATLMDAWEECHGAEEKAAAQAITEAQQHDRYDESGPHGRLLRVMADACKGDLSPRKLGMLFQKYDGTIVGGRRFVRTGVKDHRVRIKLIGAKSAASGEQPSPKEKEPSFI